MSYLQLIILVEAYLILPNIFELLIQRIEWPYWLFFGLKLAKGKHMSRKVLTIDDSQSVRQMISMTLTSSGYTVDEACDGAEGYAKATTGIYSAILTDLNMPKMNGLEFIKKYRSHPSSRGVPIIFLSTESDESSKREAKSAGAIGWIVKPFDQAQLLTVIKKVAGA